jgi:hypothetical protein
MEPVQVSHDFDVASPAHGASPDDDDDTTAGDNGYIRQPGCAASVITHTFRGRDAAACNPLGEPSALGEMEKRAL